MLGRGPLSAALSDSLNFSADVRRRRRRRERGAGTVTWQNEGEEEEEDGAAEEKTFAEQTGETVLQTLYSSSAVNMYKQRPNIDRRKADIEIHCTRFCDSLFY